MEKISKIQPTEVFKYFEEISLIPRGSGNEKAISDYLVSFAKGLNLEVIQDEALNVIIRKPGTAGYENSNTVIIQGHMDMVCEKNKGTEHDFEVDPIKLRVVGDMIYATDTTLGADNGIAMAYGMALLASKDIAHPPLEVLITTDEETGMSGAMAISKDNVKGKILINLDNEEEGHLLVSCAGGVRSIFTVNIEWEDFNKELSLLELKVRGLKGGHSGMEINKERGNSNKIMGRILKEISREVNFRIIEINGGAKDNAIPREMDVVIAASNDDIERVVDIVTTMEKMLMEELKVKDSGVKLEWEKINRDIEKMFSKDTTDKIINLLYLIPNGINTTSAEIAGLVESSSNLGLVKTVDNTVQFYSSIRSSVATLKDEIVSRSRALAEVLNVEFDTTAAYPEWQYDSNSKLRDICQGVHKEMYGKEAEIVAIHAGVECGLFNNKLGGLDMISFGPNLYDVHTPEEHMSIESVKNVWEYLKEVLKALK